MSDAAAPPPLLDCPGTRDGAPDATSPRDGDDMRGKWHERPAYTRAEWVSDTVVHVLGVGLALMAVPVLVTLALLWHGEVSIVLASAIYGLTLLAMLGCSAIYNITHGCVWTGIFRRMDHTAIFLKIAGTYTPFVVITGAHAGPLLTGLWGAAAVGAGLKIFAPHRFKMLTVGLCLGMGWAGVVVGGEVLERLSPTVVSLMVAGGLLYTAGVVFFLWASLPFHNTIWHVFVLAATAVFYIAVVLQLHHGPAMLPSGDPMSLLHPAAEAG
jgi:hemolysin III